MPACAYPDTAAARLPTVIHTSMSTSPDSHAARA